MSNFTPEQRQELLSLFAGEAREQADRVAEYLLQAERAHGEEQRDALHAAMRELHSMKGAAACVDLAGLSDQAHRLEEMLVPIRDSGDASALSQMALPLLTELGKLVDFAE